MRRLTWIAAAVIVTSGCGDDGGSPPDGPPPPITVRATSIGCFVTEGFDRVVINRADGTAVGTTTAIPTAGVTLDVEPGDAISAANAFGVVETIFGVQPGDALTFGDLCGPPTTQGSLRVTWPLVEGATSYNACTTCACMPTTINAELFASPGRCAGRDTDDITVVAYSGNTPIAMVRALGVAIPPSNEVAVGSWQPLASLAISIPSLAGATPPFVVTTSIHGGTFGLNEREDQFAALPATITRSAAPSGLPVRVVTTVGPEVVAASIPAGTATWALTTSERLPVVTAVTYDPATRRVSFERTGTAAYDAAVLDFAWRVSEGVVRTWRVVAPPDVTSFTMPRHPAMTETAAPDVGQPSAVRVALVERADLADYAAVRAVPFFGQRNYGTALFSGAAGLLRWATFEFHPDAAARR